MAVIDGTPPPGNWQFRPTKLHAYEALQTMNRCFEATLLSEALNTRVAATCHPDFPWKL